VEFDDGVVRSIHCRPLQRAGDHDARARIARGCGRGRRRRVAICHTRVAVRLRASSLERRLLDDLLAHVRSIGERVPPDLRIREESLAEILVREKLPQRPFHRLLSHRRPAFFLSSSWQAAPQLRQDLAMS
jgi:hypothetical protein